MKKFLALLIIGCMLMTALASCDLFGGGKKTEPTTTTQQDPPPPPVCDEHIDANGDLKCDACGADVPAPQPPICTEHKDEDGDYDCDACGYVMFEKVKYSLNASELETKEYSENYIIGRFTIVSKAKVVDRTKDSYTKSININNGAVKVSAPGTGELTVILQNGSSGATSQALKVTSPDGTITEYPFSADGSPVCTIKIDVTEGEWKLAKTNGTIHIYYLELECVVPVAPENGFELVSTGKVDYLVGEELDFSKLQLNSTYENGKTDTLPLSNVRVDTSKVDMSKAGTYDVTISYKNYAPITYKVNVFANEGLRLDFDAIKQISNSSAGNGVYFNNHFREVYAIGESLDTNGLSVTVSSGDKDFRVTDYTITGFDSITAGAKTLTITYGELTATVVVYVVDTAIAEGNQVKVEKGYSGTIGAIVDGYNMFATIHQALDYLARVPAAEQKLLVIGEGLFTEKLEITIPNLTIRGAGADKTTIEWDSIYGQVDAGGFVHTTDSTATVAIRDAAVNCVIEDITISNYWNSKERMKAAKLAIERALALLVQSDRFIMKDSRLLGIQDTLELFTGRQYFENVFISGYTDFVFGTNNTTYFKNCTIHTIDVDKDDKGTAGYLTAFKGSNKGEKDAITYGAIFDGCKFTADEGVATKQAIGRPWGAYAAVAVINSEIGGHISTVGYGTNNPRYTDMSGVLPTAETVQFVEYNNTGAGAITEAVAGMRMLTAEEAAMYADFAVIFGETNRNVTYLDPWDPDSEEVVVDDRTYYYFNGQTGSSGTSYTYEQSLQGTTGSIGDIAIDATVGKVVARDSDTQMNQGAKLTFSVEAGTRVTVISYPGYGHYTINGVAHNANDKFSVYFAEATEVVIEATDTAYIYQIIIDPNEEAPEAPELNEIKVSGLNVNYTVGTEFSLESLVVKAIYSDNSIHFVTDYTVDSSAVNPSAEGEYAVVITYGGKSVTVTVTYEDPNAGPEISKDTTLDFTTPDGLETVQNNPKVTITGSVRHNGGEIQIKGTISFQVKAGTVVTVIPYANSSYASYKIYAEGEESTLVYNDMQSVMFFEDCTVVYEGLDDNYLCSIIVECPLGEGKYVFGGSTVEGDVTGILESIPGLSISGTFNTHSGGAQLGADSQIIFIAPALATVTVQGYDTNYGQLLVYVDGVPVEMNANAQYVFTPTYPVTVVIEALNVGTEEAPAYNKSYITYIDLELPTYISESTTITFGSEGNYKDSVVDFSGITIVDNGGNNAQIKNGSFSFAVKKGAQVTVHAYPGYASYNFGVGDVAYEGLTDEYFTYTADVDTLITIYHTEGNNYFYSVEIKYVVEIKPENVSITFGSEGNYNSVDALDMSGMAVRDNGGNNSQLSSGSMKITVFAGATVKIHGYPGYTSYTISDGTNTTEEITVEEYTYTVEADGEIIITAVNSNNYFYGIDITY